MAIHNPVTNSYVNSNGDSEVQQGSGGASNIAVVSGGSFIPSDYDTDLTMDGTAQGVVLASGVKLGQGRIQVGNHGATTEAIRIVFGTSELNAESNLNMTTDGAPESATTGFYLSAAVDGGGWVILQVPLTSTHYAIANDVDSDTQVVSITQGN